MKKLTFVLIFLLNFMLSSAQTEFSIKSSKVTFKIKNAGFYVNGHLKGLEGKIIFSPQNLAESSIEASVKTATINTENKARDNHLSKSDYFDVAKYPIIKMKSKRFAEAKNGEFLGYFDLTIKNKTQEVKMPFSFKENGSTGFFKGSLTINRRDFGVGSYSLILSDEVVITLNIEVKSQE